MIAPFFAKPREIQSWAEAKGYHGTPYDAIYGYFRANSPIANGTLYDYVIDAMYRSGYYGTVADGLVAFFSAQTGVSGRVDAEKAFWKNTSLDFFSGAIIGNVVKDDSGNTIKEDSGNIVRDS